jgi:N-acetylglucosaminyldiphosphoundecaprenol N-acetyl-beta-D-mannosaminyltransferase
MSTATLRTRHQHAPESLQIEWPMRHDLFGVQVSATTCGELVGLILQAAEQRVPAIVSLHAVHAIIESTRSDELRAKVNRFNVVGPDGHPVRWALNHLHGLELKNRVYGPELMLRVCARAADAGIPIYLYGSTPHVLELLQHELCKRFPTLSIAGTESPPFRALTPDEDADIIRRINSSGAGILFVGLGCPKQDHFAADHADTIHAVQVCVGAAFDFHAGTKKMAPAWMQRRGLEWLYRLITEPRRLWRRYLSTNSQFLVKWLLAALAGSKS